MTSALAELRTKIITSIALMTGAMSISFFCYLASIRLAAFADFDINQFNDYQTGTDETNQK